MHRSKVKSFGRVDLQIDKNAGFRFKDNGVAIRGYDEDSCPEAIHANVTSGTESLWSGVVITRAQIDRLFRVNDSSGAKKTIARRQGAFGKPVSAGSIRLVTRDGMKLLLQVCNSGEEPLADVPEIVIANNLDDLEFVDIELSLSPAPSGSPTVQKQLFNINDPTHQRRLAKAKERAGVLNHSA